MATPLKSTAKPRKKPAAKEVGLAGIKVVARKPLKKKTSPPQASSRDTLVTLRSHVDDIEKRLKRANNLTKTSVRALKTSYEALEGDTRTAELTEHIGNLSGRLTGMIEQTRKDVGHDLRIVLNDPRLETLSGALTKANQRLTAAENQQAESINSINDHIARLATVVDERMQREERQRQKGEALIAGRMDSIEQDSANAIKSIGENIIRISEDVTEKAKGFKDELAEQDLVSQQKHEEHKHEIAQRIEAIEDDQRNHLPAFERNIEKLSLRLDVLESNVSQFEKNSELTATTSSVDIAPQIAEQVFSEGQEANVAQPMVDDAFAALELLNVQKIPSPEPSQLAITPVVVTEVQNSGQPFTPVEYVAAVANGQNAEVFSPRAYAPIDPNEAQSELYSGQQPRSEMTSREPQVYTTPAGVSDMPQGYGEQPVYEQAPPPMPNTGPHAEMPPMPTSAKMPEIQMLEPSMESVRPGAEPKHLSAKSKKQKSRKRKTGGGNDGGSNGHAMIRKVALFGGVAVVALFAYKAFAPKIFGSKDNAPQNIQASQGEQSPQETNGQLNGMQDVVASDRLTFETTEPVGDYSEAMGAPDLGDVRTKTGANKRQTLEAAATDGNAIAQFQLGLSHLEAGRNADAVRLIRLSANQGQPAAQYRLAKLYEAGIGVEVNGKTAKDLLSRAADAGNRIAMHDLGHYYATGADGASPNLQQAVKWFSMAAERGVLDSQFNLAVLYQGGSGVSLSLEEAYVWYAIAGAQGDKIATQRSEAVARELSEDDLVKAKSRIKAFAPKPVNNITNGIFKNLPWVSQKEAAVSSNDSMGVKGAQLMLTSLGYPVGTPDGSLGPNTRNAIISFERANGLPETGRVNAALIERLQMASGV